MSALPTSIRSTLTSERVSELQLWYTDELGELEIVTLAGRTLESLLASGIAANDHAHDGYGTSAGGDIVAVPDWDTFRMLPAATHGPSAAAVFCYLESTAFVGFEDFVLQ
jgi:glutamine synthetase